jgi:23S rRNA pseudouridine1911/1915/1917 synthase
VLEYLWTIIMSINLTATIPAALAGKRLDQALAELFPEYSRSRLQAWIKAGQVLIDEKPAVKSKELVTIGQKIAINASLPTQERWEAQPIQLNIVYEDEYIIVINKPAGLVVHPAVGNHAGTMLNALLYYAPELASIPRAGIIHRLDKDTSGLLVVTRNLAAHTKLVRKLSQHEIKREYEAVVNGIIISGNTIEAPIGRDPHNRLRMCVREDGKPAVTHYRVIKRYEAFTHLKVNLETGRTHQIRVHMAYIRHPIVGDQLYAPRLKVPLENFKRQALHARRLGFVHPRTNKYMEWEAPLPEDMQKLLAVLV